MRHVVVLVFVWSFYFWLRSWSKRTAEHQARVRVMESFEEDRNTFRIVQLIDLLAARKTKKLEREYAATQAVYDKLLGEEKTQRKSSTPLDVARAERFDLQRRNANAIEKRTQRRLSRLKKPFR